MINPSDMNLSMYSKTVGHRKSMRQPKKTGIEILTKKGRQPAIDTLRVKMDTLKWSARSTKCGLLARRS